LREPYASKKKTRTGMGVSEEVLADLAVRQQQMRGAAVKARL